MDKGRLKLNGCSTNRADAAATVPKTLANNTLLTLIIAGSRLYAEKIAAPIPPANKVSSAAMNRLISGLT